MSAGECRDYFLFLTCPFFTGRWRRGCSDAGLSGASERTGYLLLFQHMNDGGGQFGKIGNLPLSHRFAIAGVAKSSVGVGGWSKGLSPALWLLGELSRTAWANNEFCFCLLRRAILALFFFLSATWLDFL